MNEDDINSLCLKLHDFIERFPLLYTEEGYDWLNEFLHAELDKYVTKESNFN